LTATTPEATYRKARVASIVRTPAVAAYGNFEVFVIDAMPKVDLRQGANFGPRARAREMGMRTLREDGVGRCGGDHADEVIRRHGGWRYLTSIVQS